jgi:hypothetical protein
MDLCVIFLQRPTILAVVKLKEKIKVVEIIATAKPANLNPILGLSLLILSIKPRNQDNFLAKIRDQGRPSLRKGNLPTRKQIATYATSLATGLISVLCEERLSSNIS